MNPLITIGMHILGGIFLIGIIGSCVVVAISFVEDFQELIGK